MYNDFDWILNFGSERDGEFDVASHQELLQRKLDLLQ